MTATLHLCRGPEMKEIIREPHGEPRWCFRCRKVSDFSYVVKAPVEPSYYGPNPSIRCASCGNIDSDLFPDGRTREWE